MKLFYVSAQNYISLPLNDEVYIHILSYSLISVSYKSNNLSPVPLDGKTMEKVLLVWSVNREIINIHLRTVNALEKILCANNIFSIYI